MPTIKYDRAKIRRVTPEGLEYVTENGSLCVVEFAVCRENMKAHLGGDSGNYVGFRDYSADPPYVTLMTDPPTTFEFPRFPTWPDASGVWLTYDIEDLREFLEFRRELHALSALTMDMG